MTKNPRQAIQFATRKAAMIAACVIGWRTKDATAIEIMGFRLWSISDEHGNYLTPAEFNDLSSARAQALTPRTH